MVSKGYGLVFALLVVTALALVAPVGAAEITINPVAGAIQAGINAASDGDTIVLNPGTYSENGITITGKSLTIRADTANGHGPWDTIIDGSLSGNSILNVTTPGTPLAIENLTLRNGRSDGGSGDGYGGAIYANSGSVTVTSSTFTNCSATGSSSGGSGGAIFSDSGSVTVTSSTFTNCSATSNGGGGGGGAIYSSSVTVTSSTFTNCSATGSWGVGGAIYSSSVTVTSSTFTNCSATGGGGYGGAIYSGNVTVTSSTFTGCWVTGSVNTSSSGGAIYSESGSVTSSTFTNCSATGSEWGNGRGGAIYILHDGSVTVTSSTFTNCSATGFGGGAGSRGGAIYSESGSSVMVTSSTFTGCWVTGSGGSGGGAIYSSIFTVTSSTFTNCSATGFGGGAGGIGGAIYSYNGGGSVTSSTFTGCSATEGGAINAFSVTVTSSTFTNCSADGGGAIFSGSGSSVTSSTFTNCSASGGGAIFSGSGSSVTSSTFTGCSASIGGAIYSVNGVTVTSSTFTGCSANGWAGGDPGKGGAIYSYSGGGTIRFCRFYHDTIGKTVYSESGSLDVSDNWWGTSSGPSSSDIGGNVPVPPTWLVLGIAASPSTISTGGTSIISANLTFNSAGSNTAGIGTVPDGTPVNFTATGGTVAPSSAVTSNGIATTTFTPSGTGTATITATVDGETVAVPVTVLSGPVTHFTVSAPATATAGSPFFFTVTARDAGGYTASGYAGTVHFASNDTAATLLPSDASLSSGTGTFSATLVTAGARNISATDSGTPSLTGDSGAIIVDPAAATHFSVTAPPAATANVSFSTAVTALDTYENTATGYGGTVHFTSTDAAANLPGNTLLTSGTGAFGTTLNTEGPQRITATDTIHAGITGTSGSVTVNPGPAARFVVSAPTPVTAGSPFSVHITALDAGGNIDPAFSGTVGFASSDGTAAFSPATIALVTGEGSVQATLTTAGMQTITATSGGVTGTSGTITVSPAETTHFAVTAPGAAVAGSSIGITVTALDQYDNRNTTYDGTVNFTSTDPAAILPADSSLAAGTRTFSITMRTTGSQTITGTDSVSSSVTGTSGPVTVTAPAPVVNPTQPPTPPGSGDNDDGFPSGTVSPATTGAGDLPLMTVTVNIGGDSKAWQAIVTGMKLTDLIVTGTVQSGAGGNFTAPPGTVFQYISLIPARYNTITKAMIHFTVPQAWLDENHIAPGSIVLYHQTANGWEALPTTVLSTKDGTVYFSAESTGFSLFAIAGTPGSSAAVSLPMATTGIFADRQEPVQTEVVTKVPVKTPTTVSPPAPSAPASGFPLMTAALIGAGCIVLIGSGWYVRRWWIRRQNPALFREYD